MPSIITINRAQRSASEKQPRKRGPAKQKVTKSKKTGGQERGWKQITDERWYHLADDEKARVVRSLGWEVDPGETGLADLASQIRQFVNSPENDTSAVLPAGYDAAGSIVHQAIMQPGGYIAPNAVTNNNPPEFDPIMGEFFDFAYDPAATTTTTEADEELRAFCARLNASEGSDLSAADTEPLTEQFEDEFEAEVARALLAYNNGDSVLVATTPPPPPAFDMSMFNGIDMSQYGAARQQQALVASAVRRR